MRYLTEENNNETIIKYLESYLIKHIIHTPNHIDIDFYFLKHINKSFNGKSNQEIYNELKTNHFLGLIHPKQLYNLFEKSIKLIKKKDKLVVNYCDKNGSLENFINYFNNLSYEELRNMTIYEETNKDFKSNKLLFLVFIGNLDIGRNLLKKLLNNNISKECSFAFCIRNTIIKDIIDDIRENFDNFIIYSSREFGNDITPSLLMFDIINEKYNFDYIVKFHTKGREKIYENAVNYLLEKPLDKLISAETPLCSCVGYLYVKRENDRWNLELYKKYDNLIKRQFFVPSTIFFTKRQIVEKVLEFLKENYKSIFIQNMYDNNMINRNCSYVHFLERLFGYVE